ncbi:DMT family transporter [Marinobacterium lutimaris]|uniref:Permease of the drug/metabolite transporter (DMT) superfamily n=1 Tax=Marinobacterium lutimaris TaxID=568106 RepID=A0A1H5TGY9_9GAMM|nr:DMT family transporter [Marinobacterium lutimaris]SEF61468.1 Permease of the drug/metabolite transporter (DMT) superfamily [Marinobacterium lutimaris]
MERRGLIDGQAMGLMLLFCLCLGMQHVVLKLAGPDVAPVLMLALRSGIAAALVIGYMKWTREPLDLFGRNLRPGLAVGVLFTLEYLFLGEALRYTTASHAVVFMNASPVFSALILHFLVREERMAALQWLGILLAFGGIALAFLGQSDGPIAVPDMLWGDFLALLAGFCWAFTTVIIRASRLAHSSARQTLLYQLLVAFLLLTAAAGLSGQWGFNPTLRAFVSLGFQAVIVSFGAFMIWFWLIRHYHASRIGVLGFMTPLFGVVLGRLILDEPIALSFLFGALLVVLGILLVNGHCWLKRLLVRHRPVA